MQKENVEPDKERDILSAQPQLSATWQELLGACPPPDSASEKVVVPILEIDPWSMLLQARGTEVVDLRTIHLEISDQEVEQVLQIMQEQPPGRSTRSTKQPEISS